MTDIVVNGVTYNSVEAIAMQATNGGTVTFYPKVGYLVMFYANGGSCDVFSAYTDASGKLASLPTPTREEYRFLGWQTDDGTDIPTETVFTSDSLAVAAWESDTVTITVTGTVRTSSKSECYVVIDGQQVTSGTYQMPRNTTIRCCARAYSDSYAAKITLNGTTVAYDGDGNRETYNYIAADNATIELNCERNSYITITEGS